jgi:hypothetical protein
MGNVAIQSKHMLCTGIYSLVGLSFEIMSSPDIQTIPELKCEIPTGVEEFVDVQQTHHIYIYVMSEKRQYRSKPSNDFG